MGRLVITQTKKADQEKVFSSLISKPYWIKNFGNNWSLSSKIDEIPSKTGERFDVEWDIMGFSHEASYLVTGFESGCYCELRQIKGLFKDLAVKLAVDSEADNGAQLTLHIEYEMPFSILGTLVSDLWLKAQLKKSANEFLSHL